MAQLDNAAASRSVDAQRIASHLPAWAGELGFGAVGVSDLDLGDAPQRLRQWIEAGRHGTMDYMARHAALRGDPDALVPGAIRVISVRMDYWPAEARDAHEVLGAPDRAYVSRYALGRDYHKVLRHNLQALADRIAAAVGPFGYRVFCDSAPSWRSPSRRKRASAGAASTRSTCRATRARCISWARSTPTCRCRSPPGDRPLRQLPRVPRRVPDRRDRRPLRARRATLHQLPDDRVARRVPEALRPLVGNRIYGCDDCQLACPWNRYAQAAAHPDFARVRHGLDDASLVDLFVWTRDDFDTRMAGSAIRRIGYERWLRNLAVALGNAPTSPAVVAALRAREDDASPLVREHVAWALVRHQAA
jgi:epoxyqueuosine reductase